MADQVCVNCKSWQPTGETDRGLCHARPPVPLFGTYFGQPGSGKTQLASYFPTVAADDWCSEWKPAAGPVRITET